MEDGDEPPRPNQVPPGLQHEASAGPDGEAGATPGHEADFRALAEDWIAIWQSEITAYLTAPETQQSWAAMMAVWTGAAQAMLRAMPTSPGFGPGFSPFGMPGAGPGRRPRAAPAADERRAASASAGPAGPDAPPRSPAAADAPVARDDEVRRLEQRVAELERHLAERDRTERDRTERDRTERERADQERRRGAVGENRRTRRTGRPRG